MRRFHLVLLRSLAPLLCLAPALACYTVYDPANRVVYQSMTPPVDMSRPLHETLPGRFPGGFMVFEEGAACPVVPSLAMGQGGAASRVTSPLLTDEQTARALNLPHRSLGRGVAVVQPGDVELRPSLNVVPRGRAPATAPAQARSTEITELRNGGVIERSPSSVMGASGR